MCNLKDDGRLALIADQGTQNWVDFKNIKISIDELTIVVPMTLRTWESNYRKWILLPFVRPCGAGIQVFDVGISLAKNNKNKKHYNQVAYIEMPKYNYDKIRVDFNPNHGMDSEGGKWLIGMLHMLPNKHFSRLDIAFDILDFPQVANYDFWTYSLSKNVYYGKNQNVETKYWGTRSSLKQVRLYDKKLERKKFGENVSYTSWWRLEFQLRGAAVNNYFKIIDSMLDSFYIPNYKSSDLTDNQQNKVLRMMIDRDYYGCQTKSTRQRLRKLMKKARPDNSISSILKYVFKSNNDLIYDELIFYLSAIGVSCIDCGE